MVCRWRRTLGAVALGALAVCIVLPSVSASLYGFYDGVGTPPPAYPSPGRAVDISSAQWGAQSFQAGASYTLTRVSVWAAYVGSSGDPALLEVRGDAGGRPDMADPVLVSAAIQGSANYSWVNATFASPAPLVLGVSYWVVLRNGTGVASTGWTWWNTRSTAYIPSGAGETSTDQGATWSSGGLGDFDVRTYGYQETAMTVAIVANRTSAPAGGTVLLTLWLNNTGTVPAQQASVRLTLPGGLDYVADNSSVIGGLKSALNTWSLSNVSAGSRYFLVTLRLNATIAVGSLLTIQADLSYTDYAGSLRPPSDASVTVSSLAGRMAEPGLNPLPSAAGFLAIGLLAAFAFGATLLEWRRREAVDEVFLAHDSGVLLVHFSKSVREDKDRDILVGMLTAVQSLVKDGFSKGLAEDMRQLDFGSREILIEKGTYSYLAVVVHGHARLGLRRRMRVALSKVEATYRVAIADWDGGMEALSGADDLILRELLGTGLARMGARLIAAVTPAIRKSHEGGTESQDAGSLGFVATRLDPREAASMLLHLPELERFQPRYRSMLSTALAGIEEGAFSLADLADVYTITGKMKSPVPVGVAAWWDLFLRTIHEILSAWAWDPSGQSWTATGEMGHPAQLVPPSALADEPPVVVTRTR